MKIVSLKSFNQERINEIVAEGFKEIGLEEALPNAKLICIKPNLVTDIKEYIENGANTDIRIIGAVLEYLSKYEVKVFIAEADSGSNIKGRKLKYALKLMGVYDLKKKYSFDIINLSQEEQVEVIIPEAKFLKKIKLAKIVLDADIIINLPKIKTHKYATITCSLKKMFGTIPDPLRIVYHKNIHQTIADLNKLYLDKTYVLTDGIVAMEGSGPIYGKPVNLDLLIFSDSMYCNDIVASRIMNFKLSDIKHIQLTEFYLDDEDKEYILLEGILLNSFTKKFDPAKQNLYMKIEGKLMHYRIIVKLLNNEWIQRNITFHFREIQKRLRGGSSSWYLKSKFGTKNKVFIKKNV